MEGGEPWSLRGKEGDHLAGETWCVYEDEMWSGEADFALALWAICKLARWNMDLDGKRRCLLYRDGCLNISLGSEKDISPLFFWEAVLFVCYFVALQRSLPPTFWGLRTLLTRNHE